MRHRHVFYLLRRLSGFLLSFPFALLALVSALPRAHAQTPTLTMLHGFGFTSGDGIYPKAGLIQASDGNFYGTTLGGGAGGGNGTVFRMTPDGNVTALHGFTGSLTDGSDPVAGLIQGADGLLYGTTSSGGAKGHGTVYKVALDGSGFTLLHSFALGSGLTPYAALVEARDGYLYGTTLNSFLTPSGNATGPGVIFRLNRTGDDFAVLHTLAPGGSEGSDPESPLIQASDGSLYGTAINGGAGFSGVIFKYDVAAPSGDGFSVRYAFSMAGAEGAGPVGGLIQGRDGFLYGATGGGGADSGQQGVVYRISLDNGAPVVLHSFTGYPNEGAGPHAALIQASDGAFYGTTSSGGLGSTGTIFKITPEGVFTQLYAFADDGTDGSAPEGSLLQGADGNLYGTTVTGDPADPNLIYNFGTIFRLSGVLTPALAALPLENPATRQVAFWYLGGPSDTTVRESAYATATLPAGWEAISGDADFDNDRRNDLLLQNPNTRQVAFWFLKGAVVTGGARADQLTPPGWRVRGAGDFNSDGKPDVVLENPTTHQVAFWLMNGTHVVSGGYASLSLPAGWRIAGVADSNGDKKCDLILENPTTQRVAFWLMNGTVVASGAAASQSLPSGWRVVGTGDFNRDGVASDLVLQNTGTRKVALWRLQGAVVASGAYVDTLLPTNWKVAAPN